MKRKLCIILMVVAVFTASVSAAGLSKPKKPSISISSTSKNYCTVKASTKKVSGATSYQFEFRRYNSKGNLTRTVTVTSSSPSASKSFDRPCSNFKQTVKVKVKAKNKKTSSGWSSLSGAVTLKGNKQSCG